MNEKITLPELVAALSQHTGHSKRICEDFLKELFATVSSTLAAGESVKIRRLGTFKVVSVEPRKSVNVRTGETFEISGHRKVTFTPDRELADAVNSPFDAFQTVELADEVTDQMLDAIDNTSEEHATTDVQPAQTREIDIENPLPSATTDIPQSDPEPEPEPDFEPLPYPEDETEFVSEPEVDESKNVESKEETLPPIPANEDTELDIPTLPIPVDESVIAEQPAVTETSPATEQPAVPTEELPTPYNTQTEANSREENLAIATHSEKGHSFKYGYLWGAVSAVLLVLIIVFAWRFICPESFVAFWNPTTVQHTEQPQTSQKADEDVGISGQQEQTEQTETAQQQEVETEQEPTNATTAQEVDQQSLADTQPSDPKPEKQEKQAPVYDTISKTRFLTTMARDHYGNYHLWPYIYKENEAMLGHPDRITPGTKVVIPPASKYGIDANNPECIAKAKRMGVEIYNKYRKK